MRRQWEFSICTRCNQNFWQFSFLCAANLQELLVLGLLPDSHTLTIWLSCSRSNLASRTVWAKIDVCVSCVVWEADCPVGLHSIFSAGRLDDLTVLKRLSLGMLLTKHFPSQWVGFFLLHQTISDLSVIYSGLSLSKKTQQIIQFPEKHRMSQVILGLCKITGKQLWLQSLQMWIL